jgi:hypothetical protein
MLSRRRRKDGWMESTVETRNPASKSRHIVSWIVLILLVMFCLLLLLAWYAARDADEYTG